MRAAAYFAAIWICSAATAAAETLITSLSTDQVEISSNFTGTAITLFGAIERDATTVSRVDSYDLAVIVRGPPQRVVTRRKERFLGIWVNRHSETLVGVPAFYSLRASVPIDEISLPPILDRLEIGLDHLPLSTEDGGDASPDFRRGFLRLKQEQGLYNQQIGGIELHGSNIFQAAVRLPANVPVGEYRVIVYLFSGRAMLAESVRMFSVDKSGFEQLASTFARNQALIYGLVCVALALFIGWLAGVLFRRD